MEAGRERDSWRGTLLSMCGGFWFIGFVGKLLEERPLLTPSMDRTGGKIDVDALSDLWDIAIFVSKSFA